MIIEVPFFIQTNKFNSGPTALKMILAYFGEHYGITMLEKRMGVTKDKGTHSVQIAAAAASLGYKVKFYSRHLDFNSENAKLDFYKKYSDMDENMDERWREKAESFGAKLIQKGLKLSEIIDLVDKNNMLIALIDINVVREREEDGYQGYFVPIVGYDSKFVYIHNPGYNDHEKNIPVPKSLFDKARKAKGTDEDIIVISGKEKVLNAPKTLVLKEEVEEENVKDEEIKEEVDETQEIEEETEENEEEYRPIEKIKARFFGKKKKEKPKIEEEEPKEDFEKRLMKKEVEMMETEVKELEKKIYEIKGKLKGRK